MKKILWWGIVIILGILGILSILLGSRINEVLDSNLYGTNFGLMTTNFDDSSNNVLHIPWNFFYDFSKKKGQVSFKLDSREWSLSYITLRLPREIKNKSLEIYSINKNGEKREITNEEARIHIIHQQNESAISISQFERNFSEEEIKIDFEFKDKLEPKGRFQFTTIKYDDLVPYSYVPNPHYGNIYFNLGRKYGCETNCIDKFNFIEETFASEGGIVLDFKMATDSKFSEFRLNAYSKQSLFWKNFWIALGMSLLVSSIFLILDLYSKKTFRLN